MAAITPDALGLGARTARLRGVRTIDAGTRDLVIADGRIAEPAATAGPGHAPASGSDAVDVDAAGWVALPAPADVHAHIDKAYTWATAGEPEGSLEDAIECWGRFGETHDYTRLKANARRHLLAGLRAGVTSIRSHANFHLGADPLRGVRALVELREEFRGLVDLQVVAMYSFDRDDGLIRDAVDLGVDLIGGAPHLTPDPRAEVARAVRFAEQAGIGIDLHTDETLDPDSLDLLDLAEMTAQWPAHMIRSAGHCVSLAMQPADRLARVLDAVAAAGVSIITNPLTNLYLQGWQHPVATPRALPPLAAILDAGVVLAAGGDNVQDPFNPLGNADMVDVAGALVLAGHLTPARAWHVASAGGRAAMGLPAAGTAAGEQADLVLVRAGSLAEAVAERAPDRVVLRGGTVVARRAVSAEHLEPAADHRASHTRTSAA